MPLLHSIGTRILGLAVFLLALTIVLVSFLLVQVGHLHEEMLALTNFDVPLAAAFGRIDEYGLRRRLAFERMFGALNLSPPDGKTMAEARSNYDTFSQKLQEEFDLAERLLAQDPHEGEEAVPTAEILGLLKQIRAAYPSITEQQKQALGLQREGNHAQANLLAGSLADLQRLVQTQRAELQNVSEIRVERNARRALEREDAIVRISIAATASTVLLGLAIAMLVTRALVRPVHSLIGALGDLQDGRLDVELPVRSSDELGALTSAFNFFVREMRAKEQMRETFGRYVDPRILKTLLETDAGGEAAGVREVMTISFGDLVGFTQISERLTPANMVGLLNRHFGLQAEAVQNEQGIVDKFIGDAIMAFWGPPFVSDDLHAVRACRSALAQLSAIETLRRELPGLTGLRRDVPHVDLRLGIATGEVLVGNIGSSNTRSFTVIGDTVNLAARLEAANRFYGTQVLLSEAAARDVEGALELREIDSIAVKGKTEPVAIFELIGPADGTDDVLLRARDAYAAGLHAYRNTDWDAATAGFEACLALKPRDGACLVMLDRIAVFQKAPPGPDWDGTWRFDTK